MFHSDNDKAKIIVELNKTKFCVGFVGWRFYNVRQNNRCLKRIVGFIFGFGVGISLLLSIYM